MSPAEELYMGVGRELPAALLAFLLGGVLGGVYEVFRTPRAASRHPAAAVFAEDIIFCLIFAVSY